MAKRSKKDSKRSTQIVKKVGDAAVSVQSNTSSHIQKHLTKRVKRTKGVKRFIVGWISLVVTVALFTTIFNMRLSSQRLVSAPVAGGTYTEGIVGRVNSLNPLFASGAVDDSVTRLIFNSLLKYDTNGNLVGDLASSWSVDESKKVYTVSLRDNVTWHDGEPFTAADVVYTIQTIQDDATKSNLRSNWNSIKVAEDGRYKVKITLPAAFSPFPHSLTVPIVPKHLLKDSAGSLRTSAFSTSPVGTGPFVFSSLQSSRRGHSIEFRKNTAYFQNVPKLDSFSVKTYENAKDLADAMAGREVNAAVGLGLDQVRSLENDSGLEVSSTPLNSGVYAFFNTTKAPLGDVKIRQALVGAVNRGDFIDKFRAQYAVLNSVLLPSQAGFDAAFQQATDTKKSAALLDETGWKTSSDGNQRIKQGKTFDLTIKTLDTSEYRQVAEILSKQWTDLGLKIAVEYLSSEQLQQVALNDRDYDVLVYGITLGHDSDVYAYWHSSQAKTGGLNFSLWNSPLADTSLEIARSRDDARLRNARYSAFQKEWLDKAPAAALYQPQAFYVHHRNAAGFKSFPANSINDRLTNVQNWTINTRAAQRTP